MSSAVLVIAKDEEPYIHEFLCYYLEHLRATHVWIYDNSASNTLAGLENGNHVRVVHFPGAQKQLEAYHHFFVNHASSYRWVCVFDVDEFLVLKKHVCLHDFLEEHLASGGALAIPWKIFGSSGELYASRKPVISRFQHCASACSALIKSIVCPRDLISFNNPHYFVCAHEGTRDTRGNVVESPEHPGCADDVAVLHHYFTKSHCEFLAKMRRGRSDIAALRGQDDFFRHDCNDVLDPSLAHIWS